MSYLEKIQQCNRINAADYYPFMVDGRQIGWISKHHRRAFEQLPDVLVCRAGRFVFAEGIHDFAARTRGIARLTALLVDQGVIARYMDEIYPASFHKRDRPVFLLDRAAASGFGTRTWGQHVNGYIYRDDGIHMWVARRARDRGFFPGKLDQVVAGGLPYNLTLQQNLRKECYEEAGIAAGVSDTARQVSRINCCYENERGIKPDTLFCYDLVLPDGFQPVCQDGEVEEFMLMPVMEVASLVRDTDQFKLNCNLVIIDFLIRHQVITPDEADYPQLLEGLHA